ncbi:unnamed protein product [Linum tenue]|uniref:Uncharacterized protein n=1 Tax=Linum tenue TaxID=586396 RepID=A0AAV0MJ53_9ROSI|nr:unnamed protein product [Linum tenue]
MWIRVVIAFVLRSTCF